MDWTSLNPKEKAGRVLAFILASDCRCNLLNWFMLLLLCLSCYDTLDPGAVNLNKPSLRIFLPENFAIATRKVMNPVPGLLTLL